VHAGAGVYITYIVVTTLFNRTVVTVTVDQVKVWVGPIPAKGGFSMPSEQIVRIEAKSGSRRTSRVSVKTVDDKQRDMVIGLKSLDEAEYIAYKVGEFIGLGEPKEQAKTMEKKRLR
jgi:hypothetical protein